MDISTNQKPTIYRNLYENTAPVSQTVKVTAAQCPAKTRVGGGGRGDSETTESVKATKSRDVRNLAYLIINYFNALIAVLDEMNEVLGLLCAHVGYTGPGSPPKDGKINKMTLPSGHRIRNWSPGGLRSCTLPLGHGGSP